MPRRSRKLLRFEMLQKLISSRFLALEEGAWNVSVQFRPARASSETPLGSKCRIAAKAGTTGYLRDYRRAVDLLRRGRLR
jgi:hypothetical protein